MAQTPKTFAEYIADGNTAQFSIPFPYQSRDEVFVTVGGMGAAFTFSTAQTIRINTTPAAGVVVRVQRSTAAFSPLHEFALDAPFLPEYVDANNEQFLYVLQETNDGLRDVQRDFRSTQQALRDELNARLAEIKLSTGDASVYAAQAATSAQTASDFAQAAQRASEASGDVRFVNTYAGAVQRLPTLVEGQVVEVLKDENQYGRSTRYRVESGVLVYKPRNQSYSDQPGFGHSKYIRENPLYAEDSNYMLIGPDIYVEDGVDFVIPYNTDVTIAFGTEIQNNV